MKSVYANLRASIQTASANLTDAALVAIRFRARTARNTSVFLSIVLCACATNPSTRTDSLDECDRNRVIRNQASDSSITAHGLNSSIETGEGGHSYFPPSIKTRVYPKFPNEMIRMGQSGQVNLEVTVDDLGTVILVRTLYATNECFEKSAVVAIQSSDFYPAMKDGVEQTNTIMVPFTYRYTD